MDNSKLHLIAVTGIIEKDGKYLIAKRSEKEIARAGKWGVIGGKVEAGETISDALKREIKEEVNLEIEDQVQFFKDNQLTRPDGYNVIVLTFICKYKKGEVELDDSLTEYVWVTAEEALDYDLIGGVRKEFELILENRNVNC